jgi:hypothetical protein
LRCLRTVSSLPLRWRGVGSSCCHSGGRPPPPNLDLHCVHSSNGCRGDYCAKTTGRGDEVRKLMIFSEKVIKSLDFFRGDSFNANHNGPLSGSVSMFTGHRGVGRCQRLGFLANPWLDPDSSQECSAFPNSMRGNPKETESRQPKISRHLHVVGGAKARHRNADGISPRNAAARGIESHRAGSPSPG